MIFVYFLLIIIGFAITIKGADFLVDGASALAKRFGVSEIVIGLTIVAFGTSAPEMVVNVYSSLNGKDELILGNIIGSNLFNTLVILGIAAFIYPVTVKKTTALFEIPYSLIASLAILVLVNDSFFVSNAKNILTRGDALILFMFFIAFMVYIVVITVKGKSSLEEEVIHEMTLKKSIIYSTLGIIFLGIGGKLVVDYAVLIAKGLGVSDSLIGLTILAAGTSLPELVTAIVAAKKKKSDIVIGNVIGSNIFNVFLVLATSALISPVKFKTSLNIDLSVLSLGGILLILFMFWGKPKNVIDKKEGLILISVYIGYFIYMMIRM